MASAIQIACSALLGLAGSTLITPSSALAFSQIVPGDPSQSNTREGIIAVPLPPLDQPRDALGAADAPESEPKAPPREIERTPAALEDKNEEQQRPQTDAPEAGPVTTQPSAPQMPEPDASQPDTTAPDAPKKPQTPTASSGLTADAVPLETSIAYRDEGLPPPVRKLREQLISICRSGEIAALAPYLKSGSEQTLLSFGGNPDDPIDFLKAASGDDEGIEILAILLELLEGGHAVVEPGTENEIFVWPWFTQTRIDTLTRKQKVELFELVTAGDYEAMLDFGAYNFYRIGITPNGEIAFFVNGD